MDSLIRSWLPFIAQMYGLDINPRAIKAAWINLYLNALSEDGSPVVDHEGKTLLDRVEFHESDLLAYCRISNISLDRIVGCIPQVSFKYVWKIAQFSINPCVACVFDMLIIFLPSDFESRSSCHAKDCL